MHRFTGRKGTKGFTLIEMMVATVVFAVGMIGILKLLHTAVVANRYAKDLSSANAIMQEHLEMVTRESFNSVVNGTTGGSQPFFDNATNGDVTAADGIFTRQLTMNNVTYTATLRRQADLPRANIDTITGTVSWTDMGGRGVAMKQKARTVSFVTFRNS
ncbi:MAG: prepilin-type N-terminal cleavage/methylation domain-containing protein [Deltaproteobacteria bacterium]|nr:prepilin-type N-terminal cleavage/methylation domain-containing protein [Deltaproteobacteria bacterium]